MVWTSNRMVMPQEWWDALREKSKLPSWFRELVTWTESFGWTHMNTQTFQKPLSTWEARARYFRFLAEHSSRWMLTRVLYALESNPSGRGSHIHALWISHYDTSVTSSSIVPLWKIVKEQSVKDCLGFSRTWPLDWRKSGAAAYCLKYILKGLKALSRARIPLPHEPQEREPLWGMWTPAIDRGSSDQGKSGRTE